MSPYAVWWMLSRSAACVEAAISAWLRAEKAGYHPLPALVGVMAAVAVTITLIALPIVGDIILIRMLWDSI